MLLVDIGNSRLKWACAHGEHIDSSGAVMMADLAMLDVMAKLRDQWAALYPTRVFVVSVAVSEADEALGALCKMLWGLAPVFLTTPVAAAGIRTRYDSTGLGVDRFAAMVGARALESDPLCVIDCGTAVTIDAVDGEGVHCGGVIFPGLAMLDASLGAGTAKLAKLAAGQASTTVDILARNTADGIAAGTLHGLVGAIEHVATMQCDRLGGQCTYFITGGDAERLARHLGSIRPRYEHMLVLQGAAIMARESLC